MARFSKALNLYSKTAKDLGINNTPGVDTNVDPTLTYEFIMGNLESLHKNCVGPIMDHFNSIPGTISNIISKLSISQKVNLIIQKNENKNEIIKLLKIKRFKKPNVKFYKIDTDRIWIRDFGPIYLINKKIKKKVFINFQFNGWSKYNNFKLDNKINEKISKITKIRKLEPTFKIGKKIAKELNATIIPPFDNEKVIIGQGTAGIECIEQLNNSVHLSIP